MPYPNAGVDSKPSSSRRILRRSLPALLFALLVVAVYRDPLFTGRNFVGRDLVPYGLPMEKMVHDAWARGRIPVWSEELSGGRPLFPNPNAGTLYPARLVLSRLPFPVAMRWFPVLQWILAGLGMVALLGALGASRAAAWVGAATYVFSGVIVSEVFYLPILPPVSFHPWVLWAMARPATRFGTRAVLLGVLYGLLFLLGDVFAVGISLLAALCWIAFETAGGERRRAFVALAAGLVLAGLLAAPQIVATALLAPETRRAVSGIQLREVLGFTLSPWRLAELVVPYPFGDFWTLDDRAAWGSGVFHGFFVTLYGGAFAVVALVATWRTRVRGARCARALFLIGAAIPIVLRFVPAAWGERSSWIPLRFPEKFVVAVAFALAILAGLAFDRFRGARRVPSWVLAVAAVLAIAAVAASRFPAGAGRAASAAVGATPETAGQAGRQVATALAEGGIFWAATWIALELLRGPGRARAAAAVAILTAIPIAANRRIAHAESEASVLAPTAFARAVARRDPTGQFRTVDETVFRPPSPMMIQGPAGDPYLTESLRQNWSLATQGLWGRAAVLNLDPDRGDFSRLDSLRRVSGLAVAAPEGAGLFSSVALRFGIRWPDQSPLPGFREFGHEATRVWDENTGALPDVRLLESWREEEGAVPALRALPQLAPGEIVLETGRRASAAAAPGRLRILEKTPERLALEVASSDPTWLFVLRGYWTHRAISIDGRAVEAVPAQLAFSAVSIPAGEHRVAWAEEVPGLAASRWGPVLFVLLAGGLLVRPRAGTARGA